MIYVLGLLPLAFKVALKAAVEAPFSRSNLRHDCGYWALNFLLLTLAARPLGRPKWRKPFGLLAFFYASLHLAAGWSTEPWAWLGFGAWALMAPLAVTSNQAMMRRLGPRWKLLHSVVYPAAALVMLHLVWAQPNKLLVYGIPLLALMLFRAQARRA